MSRASQARELQELVGLTDRQTVTFERLSDPKLEELIALLYRSAADARVIRSFLDRAARAPAGRVLSLRAALADLRQPSIASRVRAARRRGT